MFVIKIVIVCILFYMLFKAVLRVLLPPAPQSGSRPNGGGPQNGSGKGEDGAKAKERTFKGGEYVDYEDVS